MHCSASALLREPDVLAAMEILRPGEDVRLAKERTG
jgi:hypothetical protein